MDPYHYSPLPPETSPPQKYLQIPGMEDGEDETMCDVMIGTIIILLVLLVIVIANLYPVIDYYYFGNKHYHF
ncbi:unnamed protein product [Caenorhabditis nigoni]